MAKKSPIEYSDDIIKSMPPVVWNLQSESKYFYNIEKGFYQELKQRDLKKFIYNHFLTTGNADQWNRAITSNIEDAIDIHPYINDIDKFNDYNSLIMLKNGIIDLDEKKEDDQPYTLIKHSPDYYFTSVVDVEYDPEAKEAPVFWETLKGIFRHRPHDREEKGEYDKEMLAAIVRLGGYILYPQNKIESLFIFYGSGSNGKSVIMEHIFKLFFTEDNMSAMSLNVMSDEEGFLREDIITSRINFATETKAGNIESEELKKIASGESIIVNRKHARSVKVNPNCKILVSANRLPRFKDTTYGTDRRLMIFDFKNKFVNEGEYNNEVDPEERGIYKTTNKDELIKNLKEETPSILNIFLSALDDLRKNNWYFPVTKNSKETKREYKEESDPIGTWLLDTYKRPRKADENSKNTVTVKQILDEYIDNQDINNSYSKKINLSTRYITKRVRELFRIEPFKYSFRINDRSTSASAFYLERKNEYQTVIDSATPAEEIANQLNMQI